MSSEFKGLATMTIDLLATAPGDLLYIAANLTKLAQDKTTAMENAQRQQEEQLLARRANGAVKPASANPENAQTPESLQ